MLIEIAQRKTVLRFFIVEVFKPEEIMFSIFNKDYSVHWSNSNGSTEAMGIDQQAHTFKVFQSVNEFKADRMNRSEQWKLENAKHMLLRERSLVEKDFRIRSNRLKARKEEIGRAASRAVASSRSYVRPFSYSSDVSRVASRSRACKSAVPRSNRSDFVTCGDSKCQGRPASVYRDKPQSSIFQTDAQMMKSPTPTMCSPVSMRSHSNNVNSLDPEDGLAVNMFQSCSRCPSKDSRARTDATWKLKGPEIRVTSASTPRNMLPEAYLSGSTGRVHKLWTRPQETSGVDIQEKVSVFVREQEEFNRQNPVNEEVVVQCEMFRKKRANGMHLSGPKFISRREAMVAGLLEKLGLEERLPAQSEPCLIVS